MRLFVAAELPQGVLEALAETSADLRAAVPGRFVGSDLFHVTLAFLGEVNAMRVPDAQRALERACADHAAFEVSLGALGSFGRRQRATLWQGFTSAEPLAGLAASVREELSYAGFEFDEKRFTPHVTLMRNADLSAGQLPMPYVARGLLDTVALFASDLSGARPVYDALQRVTLKDSMTGIQP